MSADQSWPSNEGVGSSKLYNVNINSAPVTDIYEVLHTKWMKFDESGWNAPNFFLTQNPTPGIEDARESLREKNILAKNLHYHQTFILLLVTLLHQVIILGIFLLIFDPLAGSPTYLWCLLANLPNNVNRIYSFCSQFPEIFRKCLYSRENFIDLSTQLFPYK